MKYSQDIKQEALSRYKCGSDSVKNIIEDLNVPRSTLYYWIKQEAVLPSCRYAKQPAVSQKKYEDLRRHTAKLEQYVSAAKDINLSSLLTLDEKLELYDLHEGKYSSKILCEVLGISRGTYSKRIVGRRYHPILVGRQTVLYLCSFRSFFKKNSCIQSLEKLLIQTRNGNLALCI